MLDIKKILGRSWHILWNYRTLWVFGFILALTVGASNGGGGNNSRYSANDGERDNGPAGIHAPQDWQGLQGDTPQEKLNDAFAQLGAGIAELRADYPVEFQMGIAAAITLFVMIVVLSLVGAVLRYVAETSTIRMVNEYEETGVKVGFRQGWKYGWSRVSWRLFFINLLVHLPSFFMLVLVILVAWWIVSAALSGVEATLITSLIAGIGLVFLFGFITVILMTVLYLVRDFAWRMAILEDKGVGDSFRSAFALLKRNWKNAGLMWLVVLGLKIAWALVFFLLMLPLLVISIVTMIGGILAALAPALVTAGLASLFSAPDFWPWVFAAIIGLPFFSVVAFSPILLVSGWGYIYQSSVWTLTYRELKAIETVAPVVVNE